MKCGDICRQNISKLKSGLCVKLLQLPLQGSGKALGDNLEGACSIFLQKSFILVRHIYWIFRLLRGGWLGCTRASVKWHLWPYPLKFSLWSTATTHPHCRCSPRHPGARARSSRLVKPRHAWLGLAWYGMAWLGMVWYGLVREPGAFIMTCGATCRHNISKLNSALSVKLLQLPFQGSGKALGDNLEGACSIFLQKSFILVRHIYLIFRLLCGGWLGCTRAFVKWHLWRLPVEDFALVHCHHTPTLPLHPPPPPRARSLASSRQAKAWLAWLGMLWYGLVRERGAFIMKCGDTCRHNISKLNSGLSVKLLQLPLQGSAKALADNLEGACSTFLQKSFLLVRHIYWIFRLLRGGWLGCTRAFVKWHLWPYPL